MDSWTRIEDWLKANAPNALAAIDEPASDEQIRAAEIAMNVSLPDEVRNSYRRHDGQSERGGTIAPPWALLSLEYVVSKWRKQNQLLEAGDFDGADANAIGPVRADWWNPKWIPFASDGAGSLQCIDLDPSPGGKVGQVIVYLHDHEDRECVAGSLEDWLNKLVGDLQSGKVQAQGLGGQAR